MLQKKVSQKHCVLIELNTVTEWYDNQRKLNRNFRQLLEEQFDKINPRRKLTSEEAKRLAMLEKLAEKLKHGEHVQNR